MSDTTPQPQDDQPTPPADETAEEFETPSAAAEEPPAAPSDPADHTDTAIVPELPADYVPVPAADHVADEPELPALAEERTDAAVAALPADPAEPASFDAADAAEAPRVDAGAARMETPTEPAATPDPAPVVEPAAPTVAAPAVVAPAPAAATPQYLQPIAPPKAKGNRGVGILISVIGIVVFAALSTAAAYAVLLAGADGTEIPKFLDGYLRSWEFWLPVAVFAGAFIALIAIVNRAGWWAYVLGSIFVAVFVFASYLAAAVLTSQAWNLTPAQFRTFIDTFLTGNVPYLWVAILSSFVALEVVVWIGLWIGARGKSVKRRNAEARAAHEREQLEREQAEQQGLVVTA